MPSDIAERKRFCTFGTSPLNLLPGDSLVAVVDFFVWVRSEAVVLGMFCHVSSTLLIQPIHSFQLLEAYSHPFIIPPTFVTGAR